MNVSKKHIYINDIEIRDFLNNHDLRFFKHQKYLLNKMLDIDSGFYVKLFSWDSTILLNSYEITNKIKHINIVKPLCYFEYESDIIDYLNNTKFNEFEESSVIISKYYSPVLEKIFEKDVLLQIILLLYFVFFKYSIGFQEINIDNIYIDILKKR